MVQKYDTEKTLNMPCSLCQERLFLLFSLSLSDIGKNKSFFLLQNKSTARIYANLLQHMEIQLHLEFQILKYFIRFVMMYHHLLCPELFVHRPIMSENENKVEKTTLHHFLI